MVPILGSFSRGVKEGDAAICRLSLNINATQSGTDVSWQEVTKDTDPLVAESKAA